VTTLTFESVADLQAGRVNIVAPMRVAVMPYTTIVGLRYVAGGIVGLLPLAQSGVRRLKSWWLVLNGVLIVPTVIILAAAGQSINMTAMIAATFQLATPIVIGALAGIWCERSGVVNIAIEGMMLTGAAIGFIVFTLILQSRPPEVSPQVWTKQAQLWGVLAAVAAGGVMSLLHAWLSITFKTDQIVSGVVINILAVGVTGFLRREILLSSEAGRETLQQIRLPVLADIPIVGEVLFNGRPIFYSMFVLLILTHVILYYTRWGLRTRAVGENPHAADTLGINVIRNRWTNVFVGGLIAVMERGFRWKRSVSTTI
jgi:simple sugar transport system permease protein